MITHHLDIKGKIFYNTYVSVGICKGVKYVRRTKEEAEVTRESLIDAALTVFGRKGYALTTLSDVAKEVGVTRGAIYWHFGGKEELYNELVKERFKESNEVFLQIWNSNLAPREKLQQIFTRVLQFVEENDQYRAILEVALFKTESTPATAFLQQRKCEVIEIMITSIAKVIEDGKNCGEFKADLDSLVAATTGFGMITGVISTSILNPKYISSREYAERIVDIFFNGILA